MLRIPLLKKLKRRTHREVGLAQDAVTEAVYKLDSTATLHGGTSIWRCYKGNRFSDDLDFYLTPKKEFQQELMEELKLYNMQLAKYKETVNGIYSKIRSENAVISLEASFLKKPSRVVREFERMDGTTMDVLTLTAEDLLMEKLNAFTNRKLIRDFYDVYYLSSIAEPSREQKKRIQEALAKRILPVDESNLKAIVITGAVPSFNEMVQAIKRRIK